MNVVAHRVMARGVSILAGVGLLCALGLGAQAQGTSVPPTVSGPLSIADAVKTALKNSPMALSASSQASAARARVGMARAMTRPQASATVFAGTSTMGDIITSPSGVTPAGIFTVPDRTGVTGQVGLMAPIYTGGRLSGAVRSAESLSTAAASDRGTVERNVTLETKLAYHRALLAQSTVDVYRNLVAQSQERVRIAEVAFREGRVARYDLLRNQAALAEAQQQLTNAERDALTSSIDLKTVMGVSQGSDFTLSDQLTYSQIPGEADTYVATAMKNRPEIAAARARIESARAGVDVARSAYKPQVYANVMPGISLGSGGTDSGVTAGVTVGIPLLDGGQRKSAVEEARSMLDAMTREEQQASLVVQQDVRTAWADIQAAGTNVGLAEAAVAQAEEDYRVIRLRYESGKAVNVEVLDALTALVRAQNNRLMALYEHNAARDRLSRAIAEL